MSKVPWCVEHVIGPPIALACIASWRWTTGAPMLRWRRRPARFTRGVRATGRLTLTAFASGLWLWPVWTLSITGGLLLAFAVAVAVARRQRRPQPRGVIRVRAFIGTTS